MPEIINYLAVFALGCAVGYGVREGSLESAAAALLSTARTD